MLASLQDTKTDQMSGGTTNLSANPPQILTNTPTTGSDTLQNKSFAERPTNGNARSKMNITGTWLVSENGVDSCQGTKTTKKFPIKIVQVGNKLTFTLSGFGDFKGTINGSKFIIEGFVMPIPNTNGSITFAPASYKIGSNAISYSGSGSWTFNMDSTSCSGTTESTATKLQ